VIVICDGTELRKSIAIILGVIAGYISLVAALHFLGLD
jgi:hypothetical protein